MIRSKRGRFLLARYSQIVRKMRKCTTSDGAYFLSFFEFNVFFKEKKTHFILIHLVLCSRNVNNITCNDSFDVSLSQTVGTSFLVQHYKEFYV